MCARGGGGGGERAGMGRKKKSGCICDDTDQTVLTPV